MVHVYNGILLSHEKEHIWVSSKKVDESWAYYTEQGKLEREIYISCTDAYILNL